MEVWMTTDTGLIAKLRERLGKSRAGLIEGIRRVFAGRSKIDEEIYEALEEVLVQADIGVETTIDIIEEMQRIAKERNLDAPAELQIVLKEILIEILEQGDHALRWEVAGGTHVTLVAGVNGSGKTTTVGKLAALLKGEGKNVLLGAADTFRAAAVEQLVVWSDRAGVSIVKHQEGADPASVTFDAVDSALAKGMDCLIIDTAGRLHTKVNLMEELAKIQRVIRKRIPDAPHEVLLVLDATTGQNGLQQARRFTEILNVTGIVLTKMDGTAKGGMAIAVQRQLGIPIKLIGIGEGLDDLQPFDSRQFVEALIEG